MAQGRKTRQKQQTDLKGNVSGWHVYKDERGRAVYYDIFSKTGYILANNEERYKQFSMRFVMGLIGFILILMFNMPIWLCVLAGVGVYAFLEFRFRKFLATLPRIEKMKSEASIKTLETNKVILKMVLLIALSVLIVLNAQNERYTGWMLYLNYVISALALIFALYHAKELISRKSK
jgi:uncharacterized membrane protein